MFALAPGNVDIGVGCPEGWHAYRSWSGEKPDEFYGAVRYLSENAYVRYRVTGTYLSPELTLIKAYRIVRTGTGRHERYETPAFVPDKDWEKKACAAVAAVGPEVTR